jgi:hypothetical protein
MPLQAVFERDMLRNPDRWEERYFARFVIHLWHRASGSHAPPTMAATSSALGPFQPLIDAGADGSALGSILLDVCAYHVMQTGSRQAADEFQVYYDVIPIDIALIRAMRAKEGLETPAVDHPLMSTPFARIPEGPQYDLGSDELWLRACDLLKQKMPELDLDP